MTTGYPTCDGCGLPLHPGATKVPPACDECWNRAYALRAPLTDDDGLLILDMCAAFQRPTNVSAADCMAAVLAVVRKHDAAQLAAAHAAGRLEGLNEAVRIVTSFTPAKLGCEHEGGCDHDETIDGVYLALKVALAEGEVR